MTADRWSDLLAFLAGVVGLALVVRTWPRLPRRAQIARLRHPSTPPPVTVLIDTSADEAHWRVTTPPGSFPVAVDIVTWRQLDSSQDWQSEPIVDPVVLQPGRSEVLPLVVDDPAATHLVVVAWTVRHPGGDVQGSRTLTIGARASWPPAAAPVSLAIGWSRLIASAMIAGLLVLLLLVAGWRTLDGDSGLDRDLTPATLPAPTTTITARVPTTAADSTAVVVTTAPTDNMIDTTTDTTIDTTTDTTTTTSTTAGSTEPSAVATSAVTTSAPTTIPPSIATTTDPAPAVDPDGRTIDVRGRVEDCRFGADCLIADFSANGFPTEGDYVCEFADGTRFTFRYAGGGALDACSTSGASPSITIEIDGVRSVTITREAPDGV